MKVLLTDKNTGGRIAVEVKLIKETARTYHVQLPDGKIIVRKKSRDIPKEVTNA